MTVQITILGLGQLGTSIGLALAKSKDQVTRLGNDREPEIARQAQKQGAVDKVVFNLPAAVEAADVVVLAVPFDEVYDTLKAIAQDLKPGVVVLDTSPAAQQSMSWSKELMPDSDRYFLTLTPALAARCLLDSEQESAVGRADAFQDSLMAFTSAPGTDESAITLTENFIRLVGASPMISDPLEVDGLVSATRLLPELLATSLVNAELAQPGWSEARKLAGRPYALVGQIMEEAGSARALAQAALANRENVLRLLDALSLEIRELRAELEISDAALVEARLEKAHKGHKAWWEKRLSAKWDANEKAPGMPTAGEVFGRLFGIRPRKDDKKK
jgi:prephenate dehydrogenase